MFASINFPAGKIKMTSLPLYACIATLVLAIAMTGCDESPADADLNGDNNGNGASPEDEVQVVGQSFDEQTFGRQFVETDGEFTIHGVTREVRIDGYME
ncbi:MAG: hypothetical protein R6V58_14290, partial [Planctomycetota bacterium]